MSVDVLDARLVSVAKLYNCEFYSLNYRRRRVSDSGNNSLVAKGLFFEDSWGSKLSENVSDGDKRDVESVSKASEVSSQIVSRV